MQALRWRHQVTALKRLQLRCEGRPARAVITLDGEPIAFASRIELSLDCHGASTVCLTVPAGLVDIDVDVAAFVTAHAGPQPHPSGLGPCTACGRPYGDCEQALDSGDYTTDANGNHYGLCCEDCQHLAVRI